MSGLRGKCTISHSTETRGGSLVLTPDAFFYSTLFDRYTRRTYTILPLEDIHNLPDNLLSCLVHQRLSSILVEEGSEESYKSLRTCRGCQVWCSPLVPVVFCVTCSGAFHLSCGGLSKPLARGFAWQCLGCLRAGMLSSDPSSSAADEVEKDTDTRENNANGDVTIADGDITMADETSQSVYLASLNSPYLNDEALVKEILGKTCFFCLHTDDHDHWLKFKTEREVPMEPSFPFRYFGEYSRFEDLLTDPEGRPKAVSR